MSPHVFGPVPSRRLGRSLGVDLVPFKTCTFDCLYCQLGCTTHKVVERAEFVPLDDVLRDIADRLDTEPDYITLSGSGEPTLYARLSELVAGIKARTKTPVAILTNGSLLWMPEVRDALVDVDLIVPSLDAGDETMFRRVNRPYESLTFEQLVDGLVAMRAACHGDYWLEVLLLAGLTDTADQVAKIAAHVDRIRPDRVQLNTVVRPPAESDARPVSAARLQEIARTFSVPAEIIAEHREVHERPEFVAKRDDVLEMLRRRPCTVEDIAEGLRIHRNEAVKFVEELMTAGDIEAETRDDRRYYKPVRGASSI